MLGGLKDTLAWLVGLAPSGINGAQASLLQVTSLCVEAVEAREAIVRHSVRSAATGCHQAGVRSGYQFAGGLHASRQCCHSSS